MEQYNITGMSCAACSARVEKAVSGVDGVTSCSVNLLTNSMGVEGTASAAEIIKAVTDAGYGAALKGGDSKASSANAGEALRDTETPGLIKRLVWSLIFLAPLMYISMGHMMWGWKLPSFFDGNHVAMGLAQLLLTTIIMVINQKFFISGFRAVIHKSPNMDTLVAMGSGISYLWSVYVLFHMTGAVVSGNEEAVMDDMMNFYFESAAMILTLITVGKTLEAKSKGRTTDALKGLMDLAPKTAIAVRDGAEVEVPVEELKKGDIFVVRPGGSIPVDAVIIEGDTAVNESALSGESIPVDKGVGDTVSAATINQSGFIRCEAQRVGEDTTISQIIKMVSDASATKAPIAKIADKVSGIFVPAVISVALITLIIWLLVGRDIGFALARAISVLVISCPCALGLATPVAIMVGSGVGAKNGILFKTAESLEETGKIRVAALDKTGTITRGEPQVTDIVTAENITEDELLTLAYSLEKCSEHPLAKSVLRYAEDKGVSAEEVTAFRAVAGNGLTAMLGESVISGGNFNFISTNVDVTDDMRSASERLSEEGKTPLFFALDSHLLGIIAVADVIKEESRQAVRELQDMGIRVVMLTGDNERTAKAVGAQAGVDEIIAGVLPDGKTEAVRSLRKYGKTAMVGDGINDAPALTSADTGIAIGAGADVALDAAGVVLMKSRLTDVPASIRLSRAVLKNIHENLFWAFIYNVIGIPLAAGAYIKLFGWELNPMFGAAAMSLSSFCVVTNALRLNFKKIYDPSHDKKLRPLRAAESGSRIAADVTVRVKGMMCGHCEARVKSALESLPFVISAEASFENGTVKMKVSGEVDRAAVKKAVKDAGYKFVGIE